MVNVELVIKVPEDLYEAYKGNPPMLGDVGMDMIAQAIANGTRLPKGHGDLIDRNELLKTPMNTANCPKNYVNIAQAIIQADKESDDYFKGAQEEY